MAAVSSVSKHSVCSASCLKSGSVLTHGWCKANTSCCFTLKAPPRPFLLQPTTSWKLLLSDSRSKFHVFTASRDPLDVAIKTYENKDGERPTEEFPADECATPSAPRSGRTASSLRRVVKETLTSCVRGMCANSRLSGIISTVIKSSM